MMKLNRKVDPSQHHRVLKGGRGGSGGGKAKGGSGSDVNKTSTESSTADNDGKVLVGIDRLLNPSLSKQEKTFIFAEKIEKDGIDSLKHYPTAHKHDGEWPPDATIADMDGAKHSIIIYKIMATFYFAFIGLTVISLILNYCDR